MMPSRSAAVWGLLMLVAACGTQPALVRQMRKQQLISAIRANLLQSVEAEKSAVLATTDEESLAAAREAEREAAAIAPLQQELRQLVVADGRPAEVTALDEFDTAWAELLDVDKRLLALAVANTNLKAARLSAQAGATTLGRFVDTLDALQRQTSDPEALRLLSAAAVSALRVQSLLSVHIPTHADAEMTALEQQIFTLTGTVTRSLDRLRAAGLVPAEPLADATQSWTAYQRIVTDVIRLSRENTNVISFDVSVHEKRLVTRDCLAALAALHAAVEAGPAATR